MRFSLKSAGLLALSILSVLLAQCTGSNGTPTQPISPFASSSPGTQKLYVTVASTTPPSIVSTRGASSILPSRGRSKQSGAISGQILQFVPPFSSGSFPSAQVLLPGPVGVAANNQFIAANSTTNSVTSVVLYSQPFTSSSSPAVTFFAGEESTPALMSFDGVGNLWNATGSVQEFSPPFSDSSMPALTIGLDEQTAGSVTFDTSENLYATSFGSDEVPSLYAIASPYTGSRVIIEPPGLNFAAVLAGVAVFGDELAVAVYENPDVARSGRSGQKRLRPQQTAGGMIMLYSLPLTSSSMPTAFIAAQSPGGLAFDSSGNLFAAQSFGGGGIAVYSAPLSSSSTPSFTIPVTSGDVPLGVAIGP